VNNIKKANKSNTTYLFLEMALFLLSPLAIEPGVAPECVTILLFSSLLIRKTSTCAALIVKSTILCISRSHDIVISVLLLFGRKYLSDMSVTSTWNTLDTSSLKLSSKKSRVRSTACASPPLYIRLPLGPEVNSPPYWQMAAQGEGATNPRPTGPDGERGGGRARRRRSGRQQKGEGGKEEEGGDRFVRAAG